MSFKVSQNGLRGYIWLFKMIMKKVKNYNWNTNLYLFEENFSCDYMFYVCSEIEV